MHMRSKASSLRSNQQSSRMTISDCEPRGNMKPVVWCIIHGLWQDTCLEPLDPIELHMGQQISQQSHHSPISTFETKIKL